VEFGTGCLLNEERLPQEILNWTPAGRRKRGRPKRSWKEGILHSDGRTDLVGD
jgi:hypothetical protein